MIESGRTRPFSPSVGGCVLVFLELLFSPPPPPPPPHTAPFPICARSRKNVRSMKRLEWPLQVCPVVIILKKIPTNANALQTSKTSVIVALILFSSHVVVVVVLPKIHFK